jgi:pimeloyl-ACP methyl ester carboxylesterase
VAETTTGAAPGRYVHANGLEIYYEKYGDGPPLVVLHGGTATIRHDAVFGLLYQGTVLDFLSRRTGTA